MRYTLLAAALTIGTLAFSQQPPKPESTVAAAAGKTASNLNIRGCVEGETGRFTLLQVSTGSSFEILRSNRNLSDVRGKLVDVEADEMAPSGKRGSDNLPQLKLRNLRVVGQKCPIQANRIIQSAQPVKSQSKPDSPATPRYQDEGAPNQKPPAVGIDPNSAGTTGTPSPGTGNPPR